MPHVVRIEVEQGAQPPELRQLLLMDVMVGGDNQESDPHEGAASLVIELHSANLQVQ